MDNQGRVTIRPEYRDRLGDRFVQILTPRGVLLRPIPDQLGQDDDSPDALSASGEQYALDERCHR